ncbi:MAG: transposase [Candidatus Levybacteria bacterium]|nr:transposase [Candidatus Levybacteria bacterium]
MPTNRKCIFANGEVYHIFNRGVEKRPTFTDKRELDRGIRTLDFYRFANLPLKLSKFMVLPESERMEFVKKIHGENQKLVEILCYCLMPNHFHFLVKQIRENGVSIFAANFTNSYTKYFNTKHERVGSLFQGPFKAVRVESDEQLMHVSRYIHLNPVSSFLIKPEQLEDYQWSSYPEYVGNSFNDVADKKLVLDMFSSKEKYRQFVMDQVGYMKELEQIEHLAIDD